jgi:hypothetical protein
MSSLYQAVDDYLELRRALGFKLREYGVCLREMVSFLESKGSTRITTKLAVEFATQRVRQKPVSWARQLGIVRGFALYRTGADPTTEVPPLGLLPLRSQRARPYLYTEEEIGRLLEAALKLVTPHKLQPWTYYCCSNANKQRVRSSYRQFTRDSPELGIVSEVMNAWPVSGARIPANLPRKIAEDFTACSVCWL